MHAYLYKHKFILIAEDLEFGHILVLSKTLR